MEKREALIPYYVHEGIVARMERANKRMWILCIILFLGLLLTNVGWIVYEMQYEDVVTETVESDSIWGDAYGTIVSGDGSKVIYGTREGDTD